MKNNIKIKTTISIMKKEHLKLIFLFTIVACSVFGQDKIILSKGDTLKTKIIKVSETNVTYRYFNEPEGAEYTTGKDKISKIIFSSGREEIIEKAAEPSNRWTSRVVKSKDDIQITYVSKDVEGMQALGQVFGEGGGLTNELASKQALRRLQKNAFKLGAKVVHITVSTSNYFGTWNFQGTAYK